MAHTEGPYAVNTERSDQHASYISSNLDDDAPTKNGGHWIARCTGPDHADNAKLLAAAPTLLAAAIATVEALDGRIHSNPALTALRDLKAAIAAAPK